jgi:hypothetical protein
MVDSGSLGCLKLHGSATKPLTRLLSLAEAKVEELQNEST